MLLVAGPSSRLTGISFLWFLRTVFFVESISKLIDAPHLRQDLVFANLFTFGWFEASICFFISILAIFVTEGLRLVTYRDADSLLSSLIFLLIFSFSANSLVTANSALSVVLLVEILSFSCLGIMLGACQRKSIVPDIGIRYMVFNFIGSNVMYLGFAFSFLRTGLLDFFQLRWLTEADLSSASIYVVFVSFFFKISSIPASIVSQSSYSRVPIELLQLIAGLFKFSFVVVSLR